MSEEQYDVHEEEHHHDNFYDELTHHQKITFQDVKEHIAGPIISFVVHIILVAILWNVVVFEPGRERSEIEVQAKEVEIKELEEIPEPPEPEEIEEEIDVEIDVDRPMDNQTVDVEVEVDNMDVSDAALEFDIPDVLAQESNSALKVAMPAIYKNRTVAGMKKSARKYGGRNSARTLKAVDKSLKWLARVQNPDGSWGTKWPQALTGVATLAFLAHGETPQSAEYGHTVLKAFKYLCAISKKRYGSYGYSNGIVAYAISEGYGLTKIPMLKEAMDRCIAVIVKGMNKWGSFNYGYNNALQKKRKVKDPKTGEEKWQTPRHVGEPRCDLSTAGWNYQALKAAFAAGCDVQGLEEAIDKAVNIGLKKSHYVKKDGGFSYDGGPKGGAGSRITMTSVGTLCLQLLGAGKSMQAKKGLDWIEKSGNARYMKCDWKKPAGWNLYAWYYQTQAIFQGHSGKGKAWKNWNKEFTKALLREQNSEGWWMPPMEKYGSAKAKEQGHGETVHMFKTEKNAQIYGTALCTLMLEVYYRYLPTFKVAKAGAVSTKSSFSDDDLDLDIE